MASEKDLFARVGALVANYRKRDEEAMIMRAVREGDFERVSPGSFSEDYPRPIIANRIDTMARDMTASMSPLPSFNCPASTTLKDRAKAFAAKRTKIVRNYVEQSKLQAQMPDGVDSFNCGGIFAIEIEPDFKAKLPKMRVLDGTRVYPVWNRDLEVVECVTASELSHFALQAAYPDAYATVKKSWPAATNSEDRIKVYKYQSAKETFVYLPDAGNLVLEHMPNRFGKCPIAAVPRPTGKSWNAVPRGAYVDLVWPLIAANEFRMLALEATDKSVRAPLVVPTDVTDVAFGSDAIIHTNNPQGVTRLRIDVPPAAFQASDILDNDLQVGGMSPGSRSGNVKANVITGRGIDALAEGYSGQIALLQSRVAIALQMAAMMSLEMDEKFWAGSEKEIRGQSIDSPDRMTYTPCKDIGGDYIVTVDYGFLLGLDPNRALIFVLQAQAAGLISLDTASRNLPIQLNLAEESNRIQLEQLRGSLIQSMSATAQSLPGMIAQGADPSAVISAIAAVIEGVKKGEEVEAIVAKVFAPKPPPPAPGDAGLDPSGQGGPPGSEQAGGAPAGGQALVPGAATEGPNGRPDMSQLFAGISARGGANLSGMVKRMTPVAGQ